MNNQQNTSLFELIVRTLLSTQQVKPEIIRAHLSQYAKQAGVPYDLAKQAVILVAQTRLTQKFSEL